MGCEVAKEVEEKTGTKATVINPYYITGIDEVLLEDCLLYTSRCV